VLLVLVTLNSSELSGCAAAAEVQPVPAPEHFREEEEEEEEEGEDLALGLSALKTVEVLRGSLLRAEA